MHPFMNQDFLLHNLTAKKLFYDYAVKMPIIDFHNHLDPKEIYEDKCYDNLTQVWLGRDHYKWRAMRAYGVPERLITGNGEPYDKFLAWAETVQNAIGNPLYHWTHLELKRYFGVEKPLSPSTAAQIWEICNAKLRTQEYSIRKLLFMQHVKVLCTTDDPADDLAYHRKLKEEGFEIEVLPTFRPERALGIENRDFPEYLDLLGKKTGKNLDTVEKLVQALKERLLFFIEHGCRVTDHSLEGSFYRNSTKEEAGAIFYKRLRGKELSEEECAAYKGFVLTELGKEYTRNDLAMQLHIGALRNNSQRMFSSLGKDAGFDSLNDFDYAPQISGLLNAMDLTGELPKTVLYYLNPKDADMLCAMGGNFQGNEKGIRGKIQLGSAWWFCDHKTGIRHQLEVLASNGLLSCFIGMLTDSRSFLSFPRHEYFRRILCNKIGKLVENGEYPRDMEYLGNLTENICCRNAVRYFGFQIH